MTKDKKPRTKKRGHGEGCVSQRPDGKWFAVITVGYSTGGKRIRKWVYGATKREVTDRLTRLQNQKLDRTLTATDSQRLGEYLEQWVENDTRLAPSTRTRYRGLIKKHISPLIGGLKLGTINVATVEAYLAKLKSDGAGPETVLYAYSVLHRAFERLVEQRRILFHPCSGLDRPKVERIPRSSLEPDDASALLTVAKDHRLYALFVLAVTTGMRQGELFGLQWDDVDLAGSVIHVRHSLEEVRGQLRLKPPKSKSSRRAVALSQMAVNALNERWKLAMEEDAAGVSYVFCDSDGGPLRKSNFQRRVWNPIRKAAKLPDGLRFHDLRHTSASILLKTGTHPKIVQERLGHSDIRTTLQTYSHVLQGLQTAAAATFDGLLSGNSANGCKMVVRTPETAETTNKNATQVTASQGVTKSR